MKRASALLLLLALCTLPVSGADDWGDYYTRGLDAVTARDWPTVRASMESAIALKPVAQKPVRWKNKTLEYVPHFYLGVALLELGDVDGALAAFQTSESQGVIQRTKLWTEQRRFEARAQQDKGRSAREAASDVRKVAETAIGNATMAKAGAIGAGADRSEDFQKGSRLLSDAVSAFDKTGVDQESYKVVAEKADQAKALFESALEAARSRAPARPAPRPVVDPEKAAEAARVAKQLADLREEVGTKLDGLYGRLEDAEEKHEDDAEFQTFVLNSRAQAEQWEAMIPTTTDPAELQRISQSASQSIEELAQQTAALRAAAAARIEPAPPAVAETPASAEMASKTKADLQRAWSAFVKGDVESCERIANQVVESRVGSSDAYMLRAVAAFTQAKTLEREDLLERAAADFATAVRLNASVKLDERYFSPKLVDFFGQIKKRR